MAVLFGRRMSKREILKRVGDITQIAGAMPISFNGGRAYGQAGVDIRTGAGLRFSVMPDRGLDLSFAEYKGMALSHIGKAGIVSPAFYEPEGDGLRRSFTAGLLLTCGMTQMGAPNEDLGEKLPMHGRISNLPAEDVCVSNRWEGDHFFMTVEGRMREARLFGENVVLTRKITAQLGENKIFISDRVENAGFEDTPLMLLYHFNFGYPLLDAGTKLLLPRCDTRPRDEDAAAGIGVYQEFSAPVPAYKEQVFYHDNVSAQDGKVTVSLWNPELGEHGLRLDLRYRNDTLPKLIEWKQAGEGDYVLGIEPATWYPEGRSAARAKNELLLLKPGEEKEFHLELSVAEGLQ